MVGMKLEPEIQIVRSARRRKTVSARWRNGHQTIEVLAPANMSDAELAPVIDNLRSRLIRGRERAETADDGKLNERAQMLNRQYFDGKLRLREIRYVTNQQRRFGSCTPATGTIRISHRLASMPSWVQDYVIVHELAHLIEANHGPKFWKLVNRFPKTERARGYLIALGMESERDEPAESDVA
jgi:predicted metal-dependent hydrolase